MKRLLLGFAFGIAAYSQIIISGVGGGGGGGGTPGGSDTQLQYNNAGAFGGTPGAVWEHETGLKISGPNAYLKLSTTGSLGTPIAISGTTTANALTGNGSVVGSGTSFTTQVKPGDCLNVSSGTSALVVWVDDDTHLQIAVNWCGGATFGDGTAQTMTVNPAVYSAFSPVVGNVNNAIEPFGEQIAFGVNGAEHAYWMSLDATGLMAFEDRFLNESSVVKWTEYRGTNGWELAEGQGDPTMGLALKVDFSADLISAGYPFKAPSYQSTTNCADSAGAAACGAAPAGAFVIDATTTSTVVSTTAVTATSRIFLQEDSSLGTELGVTCNTQSSLTLGALRVTARTAATSFTATIEAGPTTNPMCVSYWIVN